MRVLYLEAADDVLVRRFENTRRRHPVLAEGLTEAIEVERENLQPLLGINFIISLFGIFPSQT